MSILSRKPSLIPGVLVAAGAILAGCGSGSPSTLGTAVGCSTQGAAATATTNSYAVVADLGPLAQMYPQSQVPSSVPANAEVMLNGTMTMINGPAAQHLEIHICQRKTSEVVSGASPTIVFMDATAGTTTPVPVAVMEGVGAGEADLHYGNNVAAPVGHSFVVTVALKGEQATLRFTRNA